MRAVTTPGVEWNQGDIVDSVYFAPGDSYRPGVLLTPACDVEHDKASNWTFVGLLPDTEIARLILSERTKGWDLAPGSGSMAPPLSNNKRADLRNTLLKLINNKSWLRYHWLPVEFGEHKALVADFALVTSITPDEARANCTRIASLGSSWREQLPARYSAYIGRVGTDDFEASDVEAHVDRLVGDYLSTL